MALELDPVIQGTIRRSLPESNGWFQYIDNYRQLRLASSLIAIPPESMTEHHIQQVGLHLTDIYIREFKEIHDPQKIPIVSNFELKFIQHTSEETRRLCGIILEI